MKSINCANIERPRFITLSHLPGELTKIRRKNRGRFQIVGIGDHAKTRVIAGFQSSEVKNGRTNVTGCIKAAYALLPVCDNPS
ncbi:MAG: hypothetical protein WCH39_29505, partial [Schlesneria sp.]